MYLPRTLEAFARQASGQFPVLLVTGARQVGKTTFLRHLSEPERTYVSLDDPLVLDLARRDPALFLQRFRPPLLIDEIQYAPGLLPHIKMQADELRQPGLVWLTGSQQFHLMQGVSESLAGRVAVLHLSGLSRREAMGEGASAQPFLPTPEQLRERERTSASLDLKTLYRLIWRGSLPAIATQLAMDHDLFYGSYVQAYLQRDVRALARVGDEQAFLRFLRVSAGRSGQLLNMADLARDADIAPNTAKSWLAILQTSGIAYLLQPYHTNLSKRLVKAPKLYFLDTGLCAYLTQWSSPETLEVGAMSGAILETWVISELLKGYWHNGREAPFYYYRDRDGRELDLLIVQDGLIHPLEIKRTASPGPDDLRAAAGLRTLAEPLGPGGVICLAQQPLPLDRDNTGIPVGLI
ncbi:MAG: ATP-binding protein [Armatimonadetes bacterium]|nr:ATP-binding protein [Armatimonadota bacterium]